MSEPLSEDELAELIRSGRINISKSAAKKRRQIKATSGSPKDSKPIRAQSSSPRVEPPKKSPPIKEEEEPDSEWLRAEKEKTERNIAAKHQDKTRQEEMQEASRF